VYKNVANNVVLKRVALSASWSVYELSRCIVIVDCRLLKDMR